MSLLIPTIDDYTDAHGHPELTFAYQQVYDSIKDTKIDGKYKYPWEFEVVEGMFKQSDPATDDLKFNYTLEDFGVISDWQDICQKLKNLNDNCKSNEMYKLIFFARHGQGFHNVIVEKYGMEEWHRKWHCMETDGEIIFGPDPTLTTLGIKQAMENNAAWKQQLAKGAPLPSKFYVSPLQRSCKTLQLTWDGGIPQSIRPQIVESLRETIGINMCDKRSTKTVIKERFADFEIEDSMSEEDTLFTTTYRETLPEHSLRVNEFLQKLFDEDINSENQVDKNLAKDHEIIFTTSHAGTIRAFITVLNHRKFTISTGGMIPIVVKGTRKLD